MLEFFTEMKRRHIYRVGAAYHVVARTLAQFVEMLSQVSDLSCVVARHATGQRTCRAEPSH